MVLQTGSTELSLVDFTCTVAWLHSFVTTSIPKKLQDKDVAEGVVKDFQIMDYFLSKVDDIGEVMQQNRLRWFGHVERRDELCWIKRIETLQVDGDGVKGSPRKRWREVLRDEREGTL